MQIRIYGKDPGMVQANSVCVAECPGHMGISPKIDVKARNGRKIVREEEDLEVTIDLSMKDDQKIYFLGERTKNQDSRCTCVRSEDMLFLLGTRVSFHVLVQLVEALCGFRSRYPLL